MPRPAFARLLVAPLLLAGLLHAAPVAAQSADSVPALPFRRGQWGAEIDVVSNFSNIGFLRFRSERSAWLLGLSFGGGRSRSELDVPDDTLDQTREYDNVSASISAGLRRYRPIAAKAAAYTTVGASVGGHNASVEYDNGETYGDSQSWHAGVFGQLGGSWFVTRNMSLGASYRTGLSYRWSRDFAPGRTYTDTGWNVAGGNSNLLLTVVF